MMDRPKLIFDNHCGMCTAFCKWLSRSKGGQSIQYLSQQQFGQENELKTKLGIVELPDSIIWVKGNGYLLYADAIIAACEEVGGLWKTAILLRLIPRFLRNAIYRLIAARRHWMGSTNSCTMGNFNTEKIKHNDSSPIQEK